MTEDKPSYDALGCPGINEFDACEPEVWEFTVRQGRNSPDTQYRAVLLGKNGHFGYEEEPVVRIEWKDGEDALGVATWRSAGDELEISIVAQLLVAVRGARK